MRKIVVGLIVVALIAMAGTTIGWEVDINISVDSSKVDVSAQSTETTDDGAYALLGTSAGIDGTGTINIQGNGEEDYLTSHVIGTGNLYAYQGLIVNGCLVECSEGNCEECPSYIYTSQTGATINGSGEILLAGAAHLDNFEFDGVNGQVIFVKGSGSFTSGLLTSYIIEGMEEPVTHAMGAHGGNVKFMAYGMAGMDTGNGESAGFFKTNLHFNEPGCEIPEVEPEPEPTEEVD